MEAMVELILTSRPLEIEAVKLRQNGLGKRPHLLSVCQEDDLKTFEEWRHMRESAACCK